MRTAKEVAAVAQKKSGKPTTRSRNGDQKLAKRLASLRAGHNLGLRQVGSEAGMTAANILLTEQGLTMPSVATLARLAAFYDVTLNDLAGHMVDAAKNGDSS